MPGKRTAVEPGHRDGPDALDWESKGAKYALGRKVVRLTT